MGQISHGAQFMMVLDRRSVLLAAVLFGGATLAVVGAPGSAPFRGTTEYYVLKTARSFGDGGWRTFAFRRVLEEPHADRIFKDLLERASLAGQLYALCGLWFTDPEEFQRQVEHYQEIETQVIHSDYGGIPGCGNVARPPVSVWIRSDSPYAIRLSGPTDSVDAWRRRTNLGSGRRARDIVGGSWPDILAGRSSGSTGVDSEHQAAVARIVQALRAGEVPWLADPPSPGSEDKEWARFLRLCAEALEQYGGPPPNAVFSALDDERPEVRSATLAAITGCGPFAAEVADRIAELLIDPDGHVRAHAYQALARIGPWASRAWPLLTREVERIGPGADPETNLRELFPRNRDGSILEHATEALVRRATPKEIGYLRRLLGHPHAAIRRIVADALEYQTVLSAALLPELGETLTDAVEAVRVETCYTLTRFAEEATVAPEEGLLEILLAAFEWDSSSLVRAEAARGLGALGTNARMALPALAWALSNPTLVVRVAAAHARWEIASLGPESVPPLLAHLEYIRLRSPRAYLQPHRTATVLAGLARDGDVASSLNRWLLVDPSGPGRKQLLEGLGVSQRADTTRDGRRLIVPTLRHLARHEDPDIALAAADALYDFTGEAQLAVEHWIVRYRESGTYNALRALRQLARFQAKALPATPIAIEALNDESSHGQRATAALRLLIAIGPDVGGAAVEAIRRFAETPRPYDLTRVLAETSGSLGELAQPMLPFLVGILDHKSLAVRHAGRMAISEIVAALEEAERP